MKKIFCFFTILLLKITAFSQPMTTVEQSKKILQLLKSRDFAKVGTYLDSSIILRLDSSRIRQSWDNLIKSAGAFKSDGDVTEDHEKMFDVIVQHAVFEKKKIDIKTVFGLSGKVKGISFIPADPRERYLLPSYDKPELYKEKSLQVESGDFKLPGILTIPSTGGKFPVVILVHGSGPNDRDESFGATKIFKDFAVGLARQGIAVFRFDKRTRAYSGKISRNKNLTVADEVTDDLKAIISKVKDDSCVDGNKIYLCGHSFGATMLPRIAKENQDVKGLIFLCPNSTPLEDLYVAQTKYVVSLDANDQSKKIIDSVTTQAARIKALKDSQSGDSLFILRLPAAYWIDLRKYNAIATAKTLSQKMLFLYGRRDYQIPEQDFNKWKKEIGTAKAEFKLYPDLNHFFVKGTGKSLPDEYNKSGNVDETVINDIANWILPLNK